MVFDDPEKAMGLAMGSKAAEDFASASNSRATAEREYSKAATAVAGRPNSGIAGRDELHIFQTLVGIQFLQKGGAPIARAELIQTHPASVFQDIFRPDKAGENRFRNRGLYDRALSQEMKNRVLYSGAHYIIFSLYILQILLAATITAISAYHGTASVALTVLGALNTVVAGLLAWLTGQGMPARFRRARDQYREVVKAIEAAERMFAEAEYIEWPPGERPDPIAERNKLEELFEQARCDQEANYPDVHYTPPDRLAAEKQRRVEEELEKWKEHSHSKVAETQVLKKELEDLKLMMKGGIEHIKDHSPM